MYHNPTQMDSYNKFPGGTTQGKQQLIKALSLRTGSKSESYAPMRGKAEPMHCRTCPRCIRLCYTRIPAASNCKGRNRTTLHID